MKVLVHQIFRFCVVMLFAIFGTSMVLAGPLVASNITYFQTETTPVGQADDVGFAARAPPLAVTNVKVTGGVTVVYGSAFALYGQETVTALLGFDADHIAPNRGDELLCFVAGTPVLTTEGYKAIEDIKVGDMVITKDEEKQITTVKPVTGLVRNPDKEIFSVTLIANSGESETLGATAEHPFHIEGKGWVQAADLRVGDKVSSKDHGQLLTVKSVVVEAERQDTYNFEVADTHTYFVGKLNAWVHNTCTTKFGDFSKHFTDHGAGMTKAQYKQSAQNHIKPGGADWSASVTHNGSTKKAHVSVIGTDSSGNKLYSFSSSTPSGNRVFTHIPEGVNYQYLQNKGITLPANLQ